MSKKLYIPVALRRASDEALKNLMAMYSNKNTYVPFDNGKAVKRRIKGFDSYFLANMN